MTKEEWKTIEYFSPAENWGDPLEMDFVLVRKLDNLRALSGTPIIIHAGFATSGHSTNSFHYKGKAVDLHIIGKSLLDQFILALRIGFNGIGAYPHWNHPGLHLDTGDRRAFWSQNLQGKYITLDERAFS